MNKILVALLFVTYISTNLIARESNISSKIDQKNFDPSTLLWYDTPATVWEEALPVGNGRLGAMVFGKYDEERIQLNEDTYWSGGPYSTVVSGGAKVLPLIQKNIFEGQPIEAHKLFGRNLMGYPVEQQKYQPLANLHLFFENQKEVNGYKRWLDLNTGITSVEYSVGGVTYRREVLSSAADQVILVRLTASEPGSLTFKAQLRGVRNSAHSNYATDYFRMDAVANDGLVVNGKSADYMGIEGKLRYSAQLKAIPEGGTITASGDMLNISKADAVTIIIAAATNFVNYNDVSANEQSRVENYFNQVKGKLYEQMVSAAVANYQQLFKRVSLELPKTNNSYQATNKRIAGINENADPSLAALCYNFGRFLLISSSRPGTQPANLQGIWNDNTNPSWDSKYTTNINTEMNYWPVESGNLSECAQPLILMVRELTHQGAQVAREHYGAKGWVFHQNTDLWRVAAPMDGPTWGTFTVGGAWLTTHLWEHYLFTMNREYLREIYPVIKGSVEFFIDFLVSHPNNKWLVTNPSNSPENPPKGTGYKYFYDEVTGMYYFTTICYGSSMDMQILTDLFGYYIKAANILGVDKQFSDQVNVARAKLVPPQVGKSGCLQEWAEDYEQMEDKHRHFSHLYGLYPGNVLSARRTPQFVDAIKCVLAQRGDGGTGFSRGWKMALWARLYDGNRANSIWKGYIKEQVYPQLFAKCFTPLQVDGSLGVTAGITEMLVQSHEGLIDLLPALPDEWSDGNFNGVCARGGFELNLKWKNKTISEVEILSKAGEICRIYEGGNFKVTLNGKKTDFKINNDGTLEFKTIKGALYKLILK